jgi:SAM-dependent methyltransferase
MAATTTLPGEAYEGLAPYYDAFTAGSDYEAWTAQVLALARGYGASGIHLLDVACGTGKSFEPFMRRGFDVTACDASPAMLAQAARRAPSVRLVEADMRELPSLGEFDLITCFDDSLNHLPDEEGLVAALRSMASNLAPTGLIVFDLNTLLAYRTTFAVEKAFAHDDVTFIWSGESSADAEPGCDAAARIDLFVPVADDLCKRVTCRIQQRHFPPNRLAALAATAGLECAGAHGVLDDGSPTPEPDETRHLKALYVARLAKGGDSE